MKRLRVVWLSLVVYLAAPRLFAQPVAAPADGWVVLPVDEYRELRQRASPPAPLDAPPVEATVTRIDYELRLEADAIEGRAVLTIDVVKNGWTRVQIPVGLHATDAHLDGQAVPLIAGPPPHVLLPHSGRFVLALDIVLPLTTAAGAESVTLPPSPSAIAHVALTLPKIRGRAKDRSGAVIPGVTIVADTTAGQRTAVSAADGTFRLTNVATGSITVTASLAGFVSARRNFFFDGEARQVEFLLTVAAVAETVTVSAATPDAERSARFDEPRVVPPPQNVVNLQQRTAGVLPVHVDVPRAGTSLEFVKPLLIDDEATVRLRYTRR